MGLSERELRCAEWIAGRCWQVKVTRPYSDRLIAHLLSTGTWTEQRLMRAGRVYLNGPEAKDMPWWVKILLKLALKAIIELFIVWVLDNRNV